MTKDTNSDNSGVGNLTFDPKFFESPSKESAARIKKMENGLFNGLMECCDDPPNTNEMVSAAVAVLAFVVAGGEVEGGDVNLMDSVVHKLLDAYLGSFRNRFFTHKNVKKKAEPSND